MSLNDPGLHQLEKDYDALKEMKLWKEMESILQNEVKTTNAKLLRDDPAKPTVIAAVWQAQLQALDKMLTLPILVIEREKRRLENMD